ncbi:MULTISPECIES: type I restriction endonuclease subunit R [unclassified Streptomyces]|uniref:type I restriction endonuclease subunit R n=1 Tax=unclassified Streptomyces TaxID=2593676 RepID=UPI000DAD3389|nr:MULTISPECIES: type I restriction endonuclease subunit R [unclassified Streptomyces]PZT72472.1 type I restriction endonuclease subunit R [Streptomyces sp. AC1-42T]PZT81210.1 type I restriction endonuclease subunit R [Streptomyces sp. AC1-42W]
MRGTHPTGEPPIDRLTEKELELHALGIFGEVGWQHVPGAELGPAYGVRKGWGDLVLYPNLRKAIRRRYPQLPESAADDAIPALLAQLTQHDLRENHRFYERLTGGVSVPYDDPATGEARHAVIRPVDFGDPHANDLIAASQVRITSVKDRTFIFDIVLYVNGLPLAVIELKKADSNDSAHTAYDQLQGYRRELKQTGTFATFLVMLASDGITARMGTPFTPWQHMAPWHADDQDRMLRKHQREDGRALERMLYGAFEPARLLDLIGNFLSYSAEKSGDVNTVKLAKAHQYIAVNAAVRATEAALATDGRAGVVWHTQGAGKSEEMLFYVGKAASTPELSSPTFVMLTDRIDLDDQLFRTFAASDTLRKRIKEELQTADDAGELRRLLNSPESNGGVIFATLQKFRLTEDERKAGVRHPRISPRRDVIVVVDEAHRSHYDFIDGYARNLRDALPNATFIAFTGTPINNSTGSTQGVFGGNIHTYDLTQAVDDGATVPVFYEPHLVKVDLVKNVDLDDLNARAEGLIEGLGEDEKRAARQQFGRYEELIGSPARIRELAGGLLEHWDARSTEMQKLTGYTGKGMVVCASRAIAARLFEEVIRRRPDWKGERDPKTGLLTDTTGRIRVVFTGNAATDTEEVADYIRTPTQLKKMQARVTDPDDELELVIVQSLWLTGFDAPPLHTLYLDKRMRGAALMQAIARVNRTWPGKPSGLVVDFQGVIREIKEALAEYSEQDQADPMLGADLAGAVQIVRESHQQIVDILHRCRWKQTLAVGGPRSYREALVEVLEFLAAPEPGLEFEQATRKQRFMYHSGLLRQAFSLCPTDQRVQDLLPDIRFFESVRKSREKYTADERQEQDTATAADVELLIAQLHASVIAADGVVDIYDAAGLSKPDLSHLDESLLKKLQASKHPNLAIEALRRALLKEIRDAHPRNLTRQESFTSRVRAAMNRYTNGLLAAAEFMKFLIELAQEVSADRGRAEDLGLTEDELAFYDALAADPSAVEQMEDSVLARIAHELYEQIRKDVTVDWKLKEQSRDRIMARVLRLLRKYGYPPDKQPAAIERVLKQAEDLAEAMA